MIKSIFKKMSCSAIALCMVLTMSATPINAQSIDEAAKGSVTSI